MQAINSSLLKQYGASLNRFVKGEYIFYEGWPAHFYFQVEEGNIKMLNGGENNDYIQGVFSQGESFGEPPLIGDFPYPADARAVSGGTRRRPPRAAGRAGHAARVCRSAGPGAVPTADRPRPTGHDPAQPPRGRE